jgi:hypothetical protein
VSTNDGSTTVEAHAVTGGVNSIEPYDSLAAAGSQFFDLAWSASRTAFA